MHTMRVANAHRYEIYTGAGDFVVALAKGFGVSDVIFGTYLGLKERDEQRAGDFLSGVVSGLTHASLTGRPEVRL